MVDGRDPLSECPSDDEMIDLVLKPNLDVRVKQVIYAHMQHCAACAAKIGALAKAFDRFGSGMLETKRENGS